VAHEELERRTPDSPTWHGEEMISTNSAAYDSHIVVDLLEGRPQEVVHTILGLRMIGGRLDPTQGRQEAHEVVPHAPDVGKGATRFLSLRHS
jgi:hypothetical protein